MPRGSGWSRSPRDGTTCYVEAEGRVREGLGKAVQGACAALSEAAEASKPWKSEMRTWVQKELGEEELRRAKEDVAVANVLQEDEEYHRENTSDVLLRLEYMSSAEVRHTVIIVYLALIASLSTLIAFHNHLNKEGANMMTEMGFEYANLAIASCLALILVICIIFHTWRERLMEQTNRVWDRKQKVFFRIAMGCQGLALVMNATHIASSTLSILRECNAPFSAAVSMLYIQWIIVFAFMFIFDEIAFRHIPQQARGKVFYCEQSVWARWPHILILVLAFSTATAMLVNALAKYNDSSGNTWLEVCDIIRGGGEYNCGKVNEIFALEIVAGVLVSMYFILFLVYWGIAWYRLQNCSWLEHRWKNITLRLLVYHTFTVYVVILASVIVNIWTQRGNCERLISLYSGFMGNAIILSAWAITFGYMFSPKVDEDYSDHFRQNVLMKFLWTECDIGSEIFWCHDPSTREADVDYGPFKNLDSQPVFSFETMAKLLWFSSLIYLDEDNPEEDFQDSLETAMSLYNLKQYKVFYEPSLKVRAIVAWSDEDVVITFRGTKEASNVMADVMAWRTRHPRAPNRGQTFLGRWWMQPLVHYGFLISFLSNRIGDKVVRLVYTLVAAADGRLNVRLTGHSLGGALATLCSYEIARGCGSMLSPDQVSCYTFGSPRVGNWYLAQEIEMEVPALWNVVNGVDMIAFSGKFFGLYKHPGLKVMMDPKGDILVRPSFLEVTLRHFFFTLSVSDHLLANYTDTALSICKRYPEAKKAFHPLLTSCPSVQARLETLEYTSSRINTQQTFEISVEN